jgi:hypothetical protein
MDQHYDLMSLLGGRGSPDQGLEVLVADFDSVIHTIHTPFFSFNNYLLVSDSI